MGKGKGGGAGFSGTCIKDTWTKRKGCRVKGGRWGLLEVRDVIEARWGPLYLNNKKREKKKGTAKGVHHHQTIII